MGANLIDIWAAVTEAGEDRPQPADKRAEFTQCTKSQLSTKSLLVQWALPPHPYLPLLRSSTPPVSPSPPLTHSPDSNCVCPSSQCNFPITATRAAAQLIWSEVVSEICTSSLTLTEPPASTNCMVERVCCGLIKRWQENQFSKEQLYYHHCLF